MTNLITDYLSTIGRKGGQTTLKNRGKSYFKRLSKKGVKARRQKKLSPEKT